MGMLWQSTVGFVVGSAPVSPALPHGVQPQALLGAGDVAFNSLCWGNVLPEAADATSESTLSCCRGDFVPLFLLSS